jgi:hypothetical protein
VHLPAVQLHDLQGSLLKRLLAMHRAAGAQKAATGQEDALAAGGPQLLARPEPAGEQYDGALLAQAGLPLDSTRCADFRVPDLSLKPASGAQAAAPSAAAVAEAPRAEAEPASAASAALSAQQPAPQAQSKQPQATSGTALAVRSEVLLGWHELRQQLVEAGANPAYATEDWACTHYRWVVWKLARLQLLLGVGMGGSTDGGNGGAGPGWPPAVLTAAVVLDELKIR